MLIICTLEDKNIWVELNKEFINYEYSEENVWNNPLKTGDLAKDFDNIVKNNLNSALLFLIKEEDQIIGFMNLQISYSVWSHGRIFCLDDFFVTEKYRGKGYGKKALKELEEYAKKKGIKRIQLFGENTNPKAIKFYKRENYNEQKINLFLKYMEN